MHIDILVLVPIVFLVFGVATLYEVHKICKVFEAKCKDLVKLDK